MADTSTTKNPEKVKKDNTKTKLPPLDFDIIRQVSELQPCNPIKTLIEEAACDIYAKTFALREERCSLKQLECHNQNWTPGSLRIKVRLDSRKDARQTSEFMVREAELSNEVNRFQQKAIEIFTRQGQQNVHLAMEEHQTTLHKNFNQNCQRASELLETLH